MEFLNFGNEVKSTLCGREFHTFTTLSADTSTENLLVM